MACKTNTDSKDTPSGESSPPPTITGESPSGEPSAPTEPPASPDGGEEIDHFARDTYKIAYLCNDLSWVFNAALSNILSEMGKKYNYEYFSYSAANDSDAYINQLYSYVQTMASGALLIIALTLDSIVTKRKMKSK